MKINGVNAEHLGCANPKCSYHKLDSEWLCNRKCLNTFNSLRLIKIKAIEKEERIKKFIADNPQPECSLGSCTNLTELCTKYWIWKKYCSNECARKNTYIVACQNKGVDKLIRSESTKKKTRETRILRYGQYESDEITEKRKKTCREKYGADNPLNSDLIKEKIKNTNIEKYGVEFPFESEVIREKGKTTCNKRYGVEYALQREESKIKFQNTCLIRYGYTNAYQCKELQDKVKQNNLEKYGVEHCSQLPSFQENKKKTIIVKYNGPCYTYINYSDTGRHLMSDIGFNDLVELNQTLTIEEICRLHGMSSSSLYQRFRENGVTPKGALLSSFQKEIIEYIQSLGNFNIKTNDRKIISPLEIDIIINDKLGIECNGTYWHSEGQGKTAQYHINKTRKCNEQGLSLFHIWHHDWSNKKDIIKSILLNKLGKSTRIFGRKTRIIKLTKEQEKDFFNINHIQGHARSIVCYGLIYDKNLVAAMSFGKPRFNSKVEYELVRYACKIGVSVIGGPNKLFSAFIKDYTPKSIISYCAIERYNGEMYLNLGFRFVSISKPSYYYTKDYNTIYNRMNFQKHKLKNILDVFDENLSESENMKNNKWDRIWDCGNKVFIWYHSNII